MISLRESNRCCLHLPFGEPDTQDFFEDFYQPEYQIGQLVLHKIKVADGEILHPVKIIGYCWVGVDWEYDVLFPTDHPKYKFEDCGGDQLAEWQIERF